MIVLDTTVLSAVFRRRRRGPREDQIVAELARLLRAESPVHIPGIALQEVLSGIASEVDARRLEEALDGFHVVESSRALHVAAARVSNACRRHGIATSAPDALIAATAVEAGAELFADDPDYARMAPHCGLRMYRPRL